MSEDRSEKNAWRTALACGAVAVACMFLPQAVQSALRATANDALRPGQELLQPLLAKRQHQKPEPTEQLSTNNAQRVRDLELQIRRHALREAELRQRLDFAATNGSLPYLPTASQPLVVHELLSARVLGREKELASETSLLLDLGSASGATSEAFVIHSSQPVLDQGSESGIRTGQPVYAGRCVLGRIVRTGRWTSAVQLITDRKYAGRAQLLRSTTEGHQFGAEGMLSGLGDGLCSLTGIPYTEPVAVGDTVYTGGRSARFPSPMYYGEIVEAKLESGQRWRIVVRPQLDPALVQDVAVLREQLNTARVLGQ